MEAHSQERDGIGSPKTPYVVGGAVPLAQSVYVKRPADDELFSQLLGREFCYVLNSRQMGKTSLLKHTKERLEAQGIVCADVDLTEIGNDAVSVKQWYRSLVGIIAGKRDSGGLGLSKQWRSWWKEQGDRSPVWNFRQFLQDFVLTEITAPVAIFIDEIDSVRSLAFPMDDFFAVIRALYNRRADSDDLKRLSFCLMGIASPAELIADTSRTPFNLGKAIPLTGLEFEAARATLMPGLAYLRDPELGLRQILEWTGGQPFLTQKACRLVAEAARTNPNVSVTAVIQGEIISAWEAHDEPIHLRHIVDKMTGSDRTVQLLSLYSSIRDESPAENKVDVDGDIVETELLLSGIAERSMGQLRIYNRVYREVFDEAWIARESRRIRPEWYARKLNAWSYD